jgi:hypothetical protein
MTDAAEIEGTLMGQSRDQDRFRAGRAKNCVAACPWRLNFRGAIPEQKRHKREFRTEQRILVQGLNAERLL